MKKSPPIIVPPRVTLDDLRPDVEAVRTLTASLLERADRLPEADNREARAIEDLYAEADNVARIFKRRSS